MQFAVVNVAEELSILIYNVDTVVITVCYQYPAMTVGSDAAWIKFFFKSCTGMTRVSKSEFSVFIDHNNFSTISHTYVLINIFSDVKTPKTFGIEGLAFVIVLNTLLLSEARVTHNF